MVPCSRLSLVMGVPSQAANLSAPILTRDLPRRSLPKSSTIITITSITKMDHRRHHPGHHFLLHPVLQQPLAVVSHLCSHVHQHLRLPWAVLLSHSVDLPVPWLKPPPMTQIIQISHDHSAHGNTKSRCVRKEKDNDLVRARAEKNDMEK